MVRPTRLGHFDDPGWVTSSARLAGSYAPSACSSFACHGRQTNLLSAIPMSTGQVVAEFKLLVPYTPLAHDALSSFRAAQGLGSINCNEDLMLLRLLACSTRAGWFSRGNTEKADTKKPPKHQPRPTPPRERQRRRRRRPSKSWQPPNVTTLAPPV